MASASLAVLKVAGGAPALQRLIPLCRWQRLCRRNHMLGIDPECLHHFGPGTAQSEPVQVYYFAVQSNVAIPDIGDAGFDGNASPAGTRQHFFAVFRAFSLEPL